MNVNSRFDQGRRRLVCTLAAGAMTLGLIAGPAQAQTEIAKLTAGDAALGDQFGQSVSISGDTALVGAYLDNDAAVFDSGSAYVFVGSGTTWTQQAKLTASDAAASDFFGNSVSISGDTALVGAPLDDDAATDSGSAYVFVRSGTTWTQQAKLTAGDAAAGDVFGVSVSISGDTAVVGAFFDDDDDAGSDSGSAYVFIRSDGTWTQQAKLTASDAGALDRFGISVSISGVTAVVGALGNDNDDVGFASGSAYVFVRSDTTWTQQAKLTASDALAGDEFGISVSISGDTAVVGAHFDANPGFDTGSAYVFVRSDATWTQQAKLTAGDAAAGDRFGISVSISGVTAVVGALDDDAGTNSGSAYVFVGSGATWTQQSKLTASDAAAGDDFGFSVSISGDTTLVGAFGDDDAGPVSGSGSAYVFVLADTTPPEVSCELVPIDVEDDEGLFLVQFSVTDDTDPDPLVVAVIVCGGIEVPVTDGQLVVIELDDDACEVEEDEGILAISGSALTLEVIAEDESGNQATCIAVPLFEPDDDDDDDDDDEDDDDDD